MIFLLHFFVMIDLRCFSTVDLFISSADYLRQWFLTFLKSGNTFDCMKNLRNTEINDPKNKQKSPV